MFVVPDASLSISPSPGAHDWEPGQVAWVVDTSPNGARCVIEPLPSACTSDPDGFLLAGDGSSIGTEYDCLCADVVCEDALTGVPMATWTWDLGRVCDP